MFIQEEREFRLWAVSAKCANWRDKTISTAWTMNMFLDCKFVPFSKISLHHWQPWTKYPRFYAFAQNFPLVIVQCPSRFIPMKALNLIFFSLPLLYEADFSVSHNKVLRVAQVAVGSSTAAVLLLRWRFSHKIMEVKSNRIWQLWHVF